MDVADAMSCRCVGSLGVDPCEDPATQEDGLCDRCRHPGWGTCYDTPEGARFRAEVIEAGKQIIDELEGVE